MNSRTHMILMFLWRWKLVSTAALVTRFFPDVSPIRAYKILRRMWLRGLITRPALDGDYTEFVCTLAKKGFHVIRTELPKLREEGFRSETIHHDTLVTAVHLGDWLCAPPDGAALFTEQELRRMNPLDYPSWVPKTAIHRPDGYWRVVHPEGTGVIALEVELRKKFDTDYQFLARFYRDTSEIFRVVWLVRTRRAALKIHGALNRDVQTDPIHTFVIEKEFREKGWESRLHFGPEAGKPLSFLLGKRAEKSWKTLSPNALLDFRKFPVDTNASSTYEEEENPVLGRILPNKIRPSVSPPGLASPAIRSTTEINSPNKEGGNPNE